MTRWLAAAALCLAACSPGSRVVVGAGTTIVDSGFMDLVAAEYERAHPGVEISVVANSSSLVLELGRRGAADVLITHAPGLEADFVSEGRAARYEPVFASYFVLVGPPSLAAGLRDRSIADAFTTIAANGWTFVTRADGSGTHEAEEWAWKQAEVVPEGADWYLATGLGMGPTLQVADQRRAFTLAEIGAFLAAEDVLSLDVAELTDPEDGFTNPYRITLVDGRPGDDFVTWLLGSDGRAAVEAANQRLFGTMVYELP